MSTEPIRNVIERCRFRIDRSLDINIADVIRLIDEIEKYQIKPTVSKPVWHGLGTGD